MCKDVVCSLQFGEVFLSCAILDGISIFTYLACNLLCFPHLLVVIWYSFAVNLLVVTSGKAKVLTLKSCGDWVYGGAPACAPPHYGGALLSMGPEYFVSEKF